MTTTISTTDPGAIGAGNLWALPLDAVFGADTGTAAVFIRNAADDGWINSGIGALDAAGNIRAIVAAHYLDIPGGQGHLVVQTLTPGGTVVAGIEANDTGLALAFNGPNNQASFYLDDYGTHIAQAAEPLFLAVGAPGLTYGARPALATATDEASVVTEFNKLRAAVIAAGIATDGD